VGALTPPRHHESKIGLLGGSFNPAHEGHREISLAALGALELDSVWWLVSPGNPLKDPDAYAPYDRRMATAQRVSDHPRIIVSNFEQRKNLRYTVDTLEALTSLWPQIRFIWLMGADSLSGFHRWKDWKRIATLAPIAIFNRPGYEDAIESSEAAQYLAPFRLPENDARTLPLAEPPAWVFVHSTANPASSTAIRNIPES
jgi:nicotinate-nucleotide adenylyltransferase